MYGEDNLPDPWSNPIIQRIQKGFAPVLVADRDYWEAQKRSDPAGRWPSVPVTIPAGGEVTRPLVVFNDTFAGTRIDVAWRVVRDGAVLASGRFPLDAA